MTVEIREGDCADHLPSIDPADVALVLTDPPYGIDHDVDLRRFGAPSNREWEHAIAGDTDPFDPRPLIDRYGACVLFGANYYRERLPPGGRWIVWNKRDFNRAGHIMSDAELAWHNPGGKPVATFNWWWSGRYRRGEMGTAHHPAQKPVALMRWIIGQYTEPGDLILDPYAGAGPTLIAAKELGRRAIGIELVPEYVQTARDRLAKTRPLRSTAPKPG